MLAERTPPDDGSWIDANAVPFVVEVVVAVAIAAPVVAAASQWSSLPLPSLPSLLLLLRLVRAPLKT